MKRHWNQAGFFGAAAIAVLLVAGCDSGSRGGQTHYSSNVVTVTEANLQAEVLSSTKPVLVDFWAVWCGPCKVLVPTINEITAEYSGRVKVASVNVDEVPSIAERYGIQGMPTLLFFKNGKVVDQILGLVSKKELVDRLDKLLAESSGPTKVSMPVPAGR